MLEVAFCTECIGFCVSSVVVLDEFRGSKSLAR
jgi:hypothetical protein